MKSSLIRAAYISTLSTVAISLVLLLINYRSPHMDYAYESFAFILLAATLCFVLFVILLAGLLKANANKLKTAASAGIAFFIIPYSVWYAYYTDQLLNIMRVKIVNETNAELTQLKIAGCDTIMVAPIPADASRTISVPIKGDCSIKLYFTKGRISGERMLVPYCTYNSGGFAVYEFK